MWVHGASLSCEVDSYSLIRLFVYSLIHFFVFSGVCLEILIRVAAAVADIELGVLCTLHSIPGAQSTFTVQATVDSAVRLQMATLNVVGLVCCSSCMGVDACGLRLYVQ